MAQIQEHVRCGKRKLPASCPTAYFKRQIMGKGPTHLWNIDVIDSCLPSRLAEREQCEEHMIKDLLELQSAFLNPAISGRDFIDIIMRVYNRMALRDLDFDNGHPTEIEKVVDRRAKAYEAAEGTEILKTIIMQHEHTFSRTKEKKVARKAKGMLMECLYKAISMDTTDQIGEKVAKDLAEDEQFLVTLFQYLRHTETYGSAMKLIQDVLQYRTSVFLLDTVGADFFSKLVATFSVTKLGNFCNTLALLVSDLDIIDTRNPLAEINAKERAAGFVNPRDINQQVVLDVPGLLEKMVKFAVSTNHAPRYRGLNTEVDNWMRMIDDTNSDVLSSVDDMQLLEEQSMWVGGDSDSEEEIPSIVSEDDPESFSSAHCVPADWNSPWTNKPALLQSQKLSDKSECFYALSMLLTGPYRDSVRKRLAEGGLVQGLSNLFDNFLWRTYSAENLMPLMGEGAGESDCECSPEVSLKTMFIRFTQSFLDFPNSKHLALTRAEFAELRKINDNAGKMKSVHIKPIDSRLQCRGKEGLITKLVEVMKKEHRHNQFRFWFARALESFLRQQNSYCEQIFLLRRGLLQHVLYILLELAEDERPKANIIQSHFDLLNELCRNNVEAFKIIDDVLRSNNRRNLFIGLIDSSLVDSNLLLRSTILSYVFFTTEMIEHREYSRENTLLLHIGDMGNQISYVHRLIAYLSFSTIVQVNISCVNTMLVLLILAQRRRQLPLYLQRLKSEQDVDITRRLGGNQLMSNFRDILVFWSEHYGHPKKHGALTQLAKNTRIPTGEWKALVEMLISKNKASQTSLLYYIE